jgi:protein phosphatase-4 regulatory subunit 3
VVGVKLLGRGKDDPGTEKFLDYFYKGCIELLFKPFSDVPEFKNLIGDSIGHILIFRT